jgi:hypothetical protein
VEIAASVIEENLYVKAVRETKNITEPVTVMVRELGLNGAHLRAVVTTKTVEENFAACSDIRKQLILLIQEEPDIRFANTQIQIEKEN